MQEELYALGACYKFVTFITSSSDWPNLIVRVLYALADHSKKASSRGGLPKAPSLCHRQCGDSVWYHGLIRVVSSSRDVGVEGERFALGLSWAHRVSSESRFTFDYLPNLGIR